jgi:phosphopantetheinyl transferase (holo-ACP synthase)
MYGAPHFNEAEYGVTISHCGAIAGAIVFDLDNLKVGFDIAIEQTFSDEEANSFLSENEKILLGNQDAVSAWAAKEALSKYLQLGCYVLDTLRISTCISAGATYYFFAGMDEFAAIVRKTGRYYFAFACDVAHIHMFSEAELILPLPQDIKEHMKLETTLAGANLFPMKHEVRDISFIQEMMEIR